MRPLRRHTGRMLPLDRADVDTDQIIPKQFLKRIERSGFGPFLFHDWRKQPGFPLDRPEFKGASILVAGANFGCGSSREHAPWAIEDAGFRVVIAPSFADIFRTNCGKTGLLALTLGEGQVRQLMSIAEEAPETEVTVDLEAQTVHAPGFEARFEVDPFDKENLVNGWDDVARTLRQEDAIGAYERRNGLPS
jgi:3-isopropylmalate/(R)-2-methylmalate dehydratase small subunit